MSDYAIGQFDFVSLDGGPPPIPTEESALETRPGVDGHAMFLLGSRGRPFQMASFRDFDTLAAAETALREYQAAVNSATPVTITWAGIDNNYQYIIQGVEPIQCRVVLAGVGGLSDRKGAVLRCRWTLLPWFVIP